ncbi:MAG: PIN domain-containing protein [Chloroflexota bacterium]
MSQQVFVDTSAWVAIADHRDARHNQAVARYKQLLGHQIILVTTSLILSETYIMLRRRLGFQAAMQFLESTNQSPRVEIIFPTQDHEQQAKRILQKYNDQEFSLADAISFVCMQQTRLTRAFAYDQHFVIAGFTCLE